MTREEQKQVLECKDIAEFVEKAEKECGLGVATYIKMLVAQDLHGE